MNKSTKNNSYAFDQNRIAEYMNKMYIKELDEEPLISLGNTPDHKNNTTVISSPKSFLLNDTQREKLN